MRRKNVLIFTLVGVLAVAAVFGAMTVGSVFAQTDPTPTAPADDAQKPVPLEGDKIKGFEGGASRQDLADALGIDVARLDEALTAAGQAALKQAVDAGLLTQAQADQISARGWNFHGRMFGDQIDFNALLANELGISVEELQAAQVKAFDTALDRAVTNGRLTQAQADLIKARTLLVNSDKFQSSMNSAFEAAVQQAVSDGLITQAQADQILQNSDGLRFGAMDRGFGRFGGRGGRGGHGWDGFFPPAGPGSDDAAPSATDAPSS